MWFIYFFIDMPTFTVIFRNGDKAILSPQIITAKSEAGVGYVCGSYLRFLPWTIANRITFDVVPHLKSANQFVYGVRLGYGDKTVPHGLKEVMDLSPKNLTRHLEEMAKAREGYIYMKAPPSHKTSNFQSDRQQIATNAYQLAKTLAAAANTQEFKMMQLQERAEELAKDPRPEKQEELNRVLNNINAYKQGRSWDVNLNDRDFEEDEGGSMQVLRYHALGGEVPIPRWTYTTANIPIVGHHNELIHRIGGATLINSTPRAKRQTASALEKVAKAILKNTPKYTKQTARLARMRTKPKVIVGRNGVRIVLKKAMHIKKPSAKYPIIPRRYINVKARPYEHKNLFNPSKNLGIRGVLENALYNNSPIEQQRYIKEKVTYLQDIQDRPDFDRELKKALRPLNAYGVTQFWERLNAGMRGSVTKALQVEPMEVSFDAAENHPFPHAIGYSNQWPGSNTNLLSWTKQKAAKGQSKTQKNKKNRRRHSADRSEDNTNEN